MTDYRGEVFVQLYDESRMVQLPPTRVSVVFATDGDPRELLARLALEQALATATYVEKVVTE